MFGAGGTHEGIRNSFFINQAQIVFVDFTDSAGRTNGGIALADPDAFEGVA